MAAYRVNEIQQEEADSHSQKLHHIEYIYLFIYIILVHRQSVLHELEGQQPHQRTEGRTCQRKHIRQCDKAGEHKLARLLRVQEQEEDESKRRIMEKEGHDKAQDKPKSLLFHREIYRQQHQPRSDGTPHLDKVMKDVYIGYINQQRAEHELSHLIYCSEFQCNRNSGKKSEEEMETSSQRLDPIRHRHESCLKSGISEMEEELIVLVVRHHRRAKGSNSDQHWPKDDKPGLGTLCLVLLK